MGVVLSSSSVVDVVVAAFSGTNSENSTIAQHIPNDTQSSTTWVFGESSSHSKTYFKLQNCLPQSLA